MHTMQDLLRELWNDYAALNPQARRIHELLRGRGEEVVNDHIALRTFDDPRVGLVALAGAFERFGWRAAGEYAFREKKLRARHFEHEDPSLPKIFISELKLGECSAPLGEMVRGLVDQMPPELPRRWDFAVSGRPWRVSYAAYETLASESEYAAWVAAFGFRANHFTVLVNALKTFADLPTLNDYLKSNGFELNSSGGEIKGAAEVYLEQSSTLADRVAIDFTDGAHVIPACYYEFARRYPMADGKLYQGFVERSADRIFESTYR